MRARARSEREAGFSLIEVVVSALLVALIAAGVAQALISTAQLTADQQRQAQAHAIAQADQERLRGLSTLQLYGLNQTRTLPAINGTVYTVTSTAQYLNSSNGTSCGSSGSGAAAYYKVSSSVNWTSNTRPAVVEQSVITPPAGGALMAQVQDQTGAALPGVTVIANGPDYESNQTDSYGCVIFAGLPSGSYALTMTRTGYVDPNGNSSPPGLNATVTGTGTSTPSTNPVTLGQAASITGAFATSTALGGEADALSYYGTGASNSMSSFNSVTASSPATQLTATNLFPFAFSGPSYTHNYQVWGGKCAQMQPPAGTNQITVTPGSAPPPTTTVLEPELDVFVTNNAVRVAPAHVKITFTSASGTACTDTWLPTIVSNASTNSHGVLANPGQPFASTTTGTSGSASGGTGTLSVCADYNSHKATVSSVTDSFSSATTVNVAISSGSGSGTC